MSEWISLLKSLVWPIFLAILLFFTRKYIIMILNSISNRIERGDPFQAGPSGISLGQSNPKLTRLPEEDPVPPTTPSPSPVKTENIKKPIDESPFLYKNTIYLIHSVSAPMVDSEGIERRLVRIMLDADDSELLDRVERVIYHLHPTFTPANQAVSDRETRFELKLRPWGEFNLFADVYMQGFKEPLKLQRYLNFHISLPQQN
jgi:hypothetical protein